MLLNAVCNDVQLLNVFHIIRVVIRVITLLVPVALGIFVILDVIKTITSSDVDTKKMGKSISTRVIAAIIIFLVPAIIEFVVSNLPVNSQYLDCYINAASDDTIGSIAVEKYLDARDGTTEDPGCVPLSTSYMNASEKSKELYNKAYVKCEEARKAAKQLNKTVVYSNDYEVGSEEYERYKSALGQTYNREDAVNYIRNIITKMRAK